MARLHVHIAVEDLDQSIRFYRALFGAEPSVTREDYAKWQLDDPRMNFAISTRGESGLDHLGLQAEDAGELAAIEARIQAAGLPGAPQRGAACCYAESDKYWTMDPQGVAWEAFHTLGEAAVFSERPASDGRCCVPGMGGGCGG
ncbi:ArsI/CadI family heavy metal resistance metalloenzyme [Thiohalobacter sp.]|uniref:ArsI/CadI family heavy metal resistance metalloenzyme n=1 Tax=Thiohalobacter sp. TaxID=2025948 RepID=UPI00262B6CAA|nr:ArsI/CadI family heavy metal resistance metalloenzyme [Thiohalobacter sp.]